MSINTELARLTNAKAAIKAAIEGKGVTVPDGTLLDGMASLIEGIEAGGKIEKGVYIPTEDIELSSSKDSLHKIELNLTFDPMIFCMFIRPPYSTVANKVNAMIAINGGYYSKNLLGDLTIFSCGTNSSGSFIVKMYNHSQYYDWKNYLGANVASIYPHMTTGATLKAGAENHWMAFGEALEGVIV